MHARLIDPKAPSCPWPMCDITTGRQDGELVNFGEMAPVVTSAPGRQPAALIKATKVEHTAENKLGMVRKKRYEEALARIAELEAELEPLRKLSAAVDTLREALDLVPTPEGS